MKNLIPAIIQDSKTMEILMLGYMNEEARRLTEETGKVYFWSRSRKKLWMKGETSGNVLSVVSIVDDCDSDALLIKVNPAGPTCHTGSVSCFSDAFLRELECLIADRKEKMPEGSYTAYLFEKGVGKMVEKVKEEAAEVCKAATLEIRGRLVEESADLLYHLMVLLKENDLRFEDVVAELKKRFKM
ncbi:MAG: bifunctional phosphoribosyl-AMP cyclohydrolase/phosphoribosyl-ATP diphosphatase HisIE [Patescibacteria group bacterium]